MVRHGPAGALSASAAAAPTSNDMYELGLNFQKGDDSMRGLQFGGSPPCIQSILPGTQIEIPRGGPKSLVGFYFVALQLPHVEIFGVENPNMLKEVLQEYCHGDQAYCLILNSHPPPDVTGRRIQSWLDIEPKKKKKNEKDNFQVQAMYKYDLPVHEDLGLYVSGYPPQLTDMTPDSPLNQSICHLKYKIFWIESIVFSGGERPDLIETSVGFDSSTILQLLKSTNDVEGRQLVLKEVIPIDDESEPSRRGQKRSSAKATMDDETPWNRLCCCMY